MYPKLKAFASIFSGSISGFLSGYKNLFLLAVLVAWTLFFWKLGFNAGHGEIDEKQYNVDVAHQQNKQWAADVIKASDKLFKIGAEYEARLDEFERSKKDIPAIQIPECKDHQFGIEIEARFMKVFNEQGKVLEE